MGSAVQLRKQLESALAVRFPAALSPRVQEVPELLACGVPEVDGALGGGLPVGAISELSGAPSSGRTTLALSALARVSAQDGCCAWVDASDALNPASASALGVNLRRLLWVRAGEAEPGEAVAAAGSSPFPVAVPAPEKPKTTTFTWRHPRQEVLGLDRAVETLFHATREPREDYTPRCAESLPRPSLERVSYTPVAAGETTQQPMKPARAERKSLWTRLDQALRATDLLLAAGGFRAIVLDMGDVPPEQARRVPLATWYRFRLQAAQARTLFLLLTQVPCANSCAAVSLRCATGGAQWQRAAEHSPQLLTGLRYRVEVARSRARDFTGKKSVASTSVQWSSRTVRLG